MSRPAPSEGVAPAAVVAAARGYLGVPFRHQGRTRTGLDCLGLGAVALREAGLGCDAPTDYGRRPDFRRLRAALDLQFVRLPRATPLSAGLIACFRDHGWLHTGIMTGPASFIHSRGPEGVGAGVIEHSLDDQSWAPRLLGAWRHAGMRWEVR